MRQKLCHLSTLPHLQLPDNLVFSRVLTGDTAGRANHGCTLRSRLLRFFLADDTHVLEVKDDAQQTLNIVSLLHFKVSIADNDHAIDSALLLTLLDHLKRYLNCTNLSIAIMVDQGDVDLVVCQYSA